VPDVSPKPKFRASKYTIMIEFAESALTWFSVYRFVAGDLLIAIIAFAGVLIVGGFVVSAMAADYEKYRAGLEEKGTANE
jgi:glucokinase